MSKPSISQRALAVQSKPPELIIGGRTYSAIKQTVVPTLRQRKDKPVAFTVLEKMRVGKSIRPKPGEPAMPAATLVRVLDLTTNRQCDYVVPAILKSTWIEEYDGGHVDGDGAADLTTGEHTYVGKSFVVQKGEQEEGKRYRNLVVYEIDATQAVE